MRPATNTSGGVRYADDVCPDCAATRRQRRAKTSWNPSVGRCRWVAARPLARGVVEHGSSHERVAGRGVADGVAVAVIVEVAEHLQPDPFPLVHAVGPAAEVVVPVGAGVE